MNVRRARVFWISVVTAPCLGAVLLACAHRKAGVGAAGGDEWQAPEPQQASRFSMSQPVPERGSQPAKPVREHSIHQIIPYTLKVRRPPVVGADPQAGPGGVDYRTDPLPDASFDCHDTQWLFKDIRLTELRACFAVIRAGAESGSGPPFLRFHLKRDPAGPELELETDEDTPECLKTAIGRLPVPREIFFQSREGGRMACYASRFAVEANEIMGFKMPMNKQALKVSLPLDPWPETEADMRMTLTGWALTPYWEAGKGALLSRVVPDAICRRCLGEKTMLGPNDTPPVVWPPSPTPSPSPSPGAVPSPGSTLKPAR